MTSDEIEILRFASGLVAYGRHLATSAGGKIHEFEDGIICDGGYASSFHNMLVPMRAFSSAEWVDLKKQLLDFYGRENGWTIRSVFDDDLSKFGFRILATNPIMVRTKQNNTIDSNCPALMFKEVLDNQGVITFEKIREESYVRKIPEHDFGKGYLDSRILGNGLRMWLGYMNERPVATSCLFESNEISMIKNMSTLPELRGQGIGTAMCINTINVCAHKLMLDSDPMARNIYPKLGFSTLGSLTYWQLDTK